MKTNKSKALLYLFYRLQKLRPMCPHILPRAVPELCPLYHTACKNTADLLFAAFSAMEIFPADSALFSQFLVNRISRWSCTWWMK